MICFPSLAKIRGRKINANFFRTKFFGNPSGHGRPRQKSWTSAPKSTFSCSPGGGEKLFDPWAFGRKGQECPREIRTNKFMFMPLLIFPLERFLGFPSLEDFCEQQGQEGQGSVLPWQNIIGALQKGPPFHGSQSYRGMKMQNESCQVSGREVTGR